MAHFNAQPWVFPWTCLIIVKILVFLHYRWWLVVSIDLLIELPPQVSIMKGANFWISLLNLLLIPQSNLGLMYISSVTTVILAAELLQFWIQNFVLSALLCSRCGSENLYTLVSFHFWLFEHMTVLTIDYLSVDHLCVVFYYVEYDVSTSWSLLQVVLSSSLRRFFVHWVVQFHLLVKPHSFLQVGRLKMLATFRGFNLSFDRRQFLFKIYVS